ncbi:translation initiation factor IF-2-like [Accipiter gentilis]|uniref:translation initiation factor IF-2-like n=1 Tax=Astur gentilis TaxID=8957 RepID=UPI00210FA73B|nr:translation initiation factor IF-2-like [Accipiter gentilis]
MGCWELCAAGPGVRQGRGLPWAHPGGMRWLGVPGTRLFRHPRAAPLCSGHPGTGRGPLVGPGSTRQGAGGADAAADQRVEKQHLRCPPHRVAHRTAPCRPRHPAPLPTLPCPPLHSPNRCVSLLHRIARRTVPPRPGQSGAGLGGPLRPPAPHAAPPHPSAPSSRAAALGMGTGMGTGTTAGPGAAAPAERSRLRPKPHLSPRPAAAPGAPGDVKQTACCRQLLLIDPAPGTPDHSNPPPGSTRLTPGTNPPARLLGGTRRDIDGGTRRDIDGGTRRDIHGGAHMDIDGGTCMDIHGGTHRDIDGAHAGTQMGEHAWTYMEEHTGT